MKKEQGFDQGVYFFLNLHLCPSKGERDGIPRPGWKSLAE